MIVVRVAVHSAVTGVVTELGRLEICNDGTGNAQHGNYDVRLYSGVETCAQRTTRVERHPRLRTPIWVLVAKACVSTLRSPQQRKKLADAIKARPDD